MKKVLLTHSIKEHGIWQDISKWILWVYKVIENRRQELVKNKSKNSHRSSIDESYSPNKKSTTQWIKGFTKYLIGKGPHSEDERFISDDITKNIIFNVLSQFIYHFANFGVALEGGKKLILYFCDKYSMDKSRVHTLLTEYEAIQRKGGHILNEKEKLMVPMMKRNERLMKYGYDNMTMVVGLVIPFIGDDSTCVKILQTCKQFNEVFKDEIYKQCLIATERSVIRYSKRHAIWSYFLVKDTVVDYEALRDKINQNTEYIKSVDEVISMDVNRSYTNVKNLNQTALKNILRTYAFYNAEIKYCQGMNFLAGFLFMFFKDESTTFRAFCGLFENLEMTELFQNDLEKLKLFFYKMDRLVSMYLPDLYTHLKNECVQSSLY